MPPRSKKVDRLKLLGAVQTPLGFYVLALLIIESTLGMVLSLAGFEQHYKWYGFLLMIAVFTGVVLVVSGLTVFKPKNLLYGKEHSAPQIEPSALRDQIEDIIHQKVKSEYLISGKGEKL
jgi:hypothetical protein